MKSYSDIVGDGGSGIAAQVAAQRARIDERLSQVRHVVAVGSGKGGVGKSTLTLQLAAALSRSGSACAVLDADMNGPSQARMAGLRDVPFVPGPDGLCLPRTQDGIGVVSLGSVIPETEALGFDSVARGDSHTWRATREFTALGELIASVDWGALDYLWVDLPPGAERTVQYAEFLGEAASFVLVTIPSDVSRGVVSRSVAALQAAPNKTLGYIENMKGYYCAGCGEVKPLFPDSGVFEPGIVCLGAVPFDPDLARRCDDGDAAGGDPGGPVGRAVREAAQVIARRLEASE